METSLLRGGETRRGGKLWNVYQDFGIFDWGTFQEGKASKSYPGTKNTRRNTGNTRINTTSGPKYKNKYRKDRGKYSLLNFSSDRMETSTERAETTPHQPGKSWIVIYDHHINKHCQRHNGPEGWVLLTTISCTHLDIVHSSQYV